MWVCGWYMVYSLVQLIDWCMVCGLVYGVCVGTWFVGWDMVYVLEHGLRVGVLGMCWNMVNGLEHGVCVGTWFVGWGIVYVLEHG